MPMELAKFSGTADDPHWTGTSLNPPTTPIKPALGVFFTTTEYGVRTDYYGVLSTVPEKMEDQEIGKEALLAGIRLSLI